MQPVLPNQCSLFYPKQMQPVLPNKCSLFYLTNAACFTQPMQTVLPNKCSLFYPTNAACYTQPMVYQNRYVSGWLHCPKNNMNLCIKAKLNVPGADATVYMLYILLLILVSGGETKHIPLNAAVTGSVFMRRIRLQYFRKV